MPPSPEPPRALATLARAVMVGVALAGIVALAYAVNRFRTIDDPHALEWYAAAIGVAGFGVWGALTAPALRATLAMLCISTGGALLATEWFLEARRERRVLGIRNAVAEATGVTPDLRSVPQVVMDMRASGLPAVPSIVPTVILDQSGPDADPRSAFTAPILPLGGVAHRATVQACNEDGRYPIYQSDRHGFMNPDEVWDGPASIVAIGDSFTHGYCVQPDSTLPAQLRRRWPRTINLGGGGNGPLSELAALTEYGLPASPEVVLWVYFENDLGDLARERRNSTLMSYRKEGYTQSLLDRRAEIDSALTEWIDRVYGGGLAQDPFTDTGGLRSILTLSALRELVAGNREPPPDPRLQVPLFAETLAIARDRTIAAGARFVLVVLPQWERFFTPEVLVENAGRGEVIAAADSLGITTIDLLPAISSAPDTAALFGRGRLASAHYGPAGYAFVAEAISNALDSLGIAPAR